MTHIITLFRRTFLHRRLLAATAAAICVLAVCAIASGHEESVISVYTAIDRIPPGTVITTSHVRATDAPASLVPDSAITSLADLDAHMTAAPISAGAILTADSFVTVSQAAVGHVIVPVKISPQILSILHPGDHVSIFLSDPITGAATVVRGTRVVTIPAASASGAFSSSGTNDVILVEVPESIATQITSTNLSGSVTVAVE